MKFQKIEKRPDVAEQKVKGTSSLGPGEQNFRRIFVSTTICLAIVDRQGRCVDMNKAMLEYLGLSPESTIGEIGEMLLVLSDKQRHDEITAKMERDGTVKNMEMRLRAKDGSYRDALLSIEPIVVGSASSWLTIWTDITSFKKAEERVKKLNRVYAVLSDVNQVIVRHRNLPELFDKVCQIAVEKGGFAHASIAFLDERTQQVTIAAHGGKSDGYIEQFTNSLNEAPKPYCPIDSALRGHGGILCSPTGPAEELHACQNCAQRLGFQSVVSFPLRVFDKVRGSINLYSDRLSFFDEEELKLLDEMSLDVSFAMEFIEEEAERKGAEEASRDTQAQTRLFVEQAPLSIAMFDREMKCLAASRRWIEEFELGNTKLIGLNHYDLHPDISDSWREAHRRGLQGESVHKDEDVWTRADGSSHWLRWAVHPWMDDARKIGGIIISLEDITDRKQAEEARRDSEKRYRLISEHSADVIWILDLATQRFSYVSPSVYRLRGYTPEEVMAQSFERALVPEAYSLIAEDLPKRLKAFAEGDESARVQTREIDQPHKNGSTVQTEVVTTLLTDELGRATEVLGVSRDISDRKRAETALRESEERFRKAFYTSPDSININRLHDGVYVLINKGFIDITGYSEKELLGISSLDLNIWAHPADRQRLISGLKEKGEVRNLEAQFRLKNGEIRYGLMSASVIELSGVPHILSITRDITNRRRAEEGLRESEARYRTLTEAAQDSIFIVDRDDVVQFVNTAAAKFLGRTPQDIVGRKRSEFFPPDVGGTQEKSIQKVLKSGEPASDESPHLSSRGEVWLNTSLAPLKNDEGNVVAVLGISREITERKRAEETRRLLAHTMESISEIATITDLQNRLTYVNESFVRTYGYERNEVIGRHIGFLWSPNNPSGLLEEILSKSKIGFWKGEVLNVTKNGREFPLFLRASLVRDDSGATIGLVGISEDVSERKQLEAQFLQAQKMEAVGRLAGGVAHDFNNMIGVILGYAVLMEQQLKPADPLLHRVRAIISCAEKSANLTRQLLAFARKQIISPVPLNLSNAVLSIQAMLARLIGEDITLHIHADDNLWNVKFDPTQFDQVLANLATNARDAITDVGIITIEMMNVVIDSRYKGAHLDFVPGEYVMVAFSDTGVGMDKETQANIFEPFFTTKPEGEGTGLGLATVFGIVKQNNGFINVYSESGNGTTFKIFFPRYYGAAETVSEKEEDIPLKGTETILVVEDEEELLTLCKKALEMQGYTVLAADSPGDAILICQQQDRTIDLLVSDVVMPGMNGKELREKLESIKPGMKVIFMSGYTADVVAHRGIMDEGLQFLAKPFTPQALVKKVRKVLNG